MPEGRFGLLFIDGDGKVYPAYPKGKENRETVDNLVQLGMFGETIIIDRNNQIAKLNDDKLAKFEEENNA